tara:strand:+ start:1078 stop:1305 length:228 start_codon:yes stop_codon:yes gene_type:complete
MDFDEQVDLEHLLFLDRRCKTCGEVKNLLEDYYQTRKNKGSLPSSYSYECKDCMKSRVIRNRKKNTPVHEMYPDW